MKTEYIWRERKRNIFGLPWSFTVYSLTKDKLMVDTGFLNRKSDEVLLYRFIDLSVKESLIQRIFGIGTIHCCTTDKSTAEFDLINVKNARAVKEQISQIIEEYRDRKGYTVRELMGNSADDVGEAHDEFME